MVEAKKPRPKKAPAKKATTEPRKVGHPSVFDAQRSDILLNAIRIGTPYQLACDFAGIHRDTLRKWRRRGEQALLIPSGRRGPTDRKFAEFVGALDKALAESGVRAQQTIHTLMTLDVKNTTPEQQRVAMSAAQFHLTHRLADYYTTKTSTELTGKDGGPIDVALSAERAWEILQAINKGEPLSTAEDEASED